MKILRSSFIAVGLACLSTPVLAAGISVFDFTTDSKQSFSNGHVFQPNIGDPGDITGYGFHLYYDKGPLPYDATNHTAFVADETFNVGMKSNKNGIGVRDIQVGNIGNQLGQDGRVKQEVLLFEFGSAFDWTPISTTFTTGNPTTALVFGGNNVGTTAGTFSLNQMSLISVIDIDDDPFKENFGLSQTFEFIAFAAIPNLDGTYPRENFQIAEVVGAVPVPAALPLLATAFGGLAFLSWRRKRQEVA